MVIFENIKYKNFLSYGNYWTEFKLNEHKNTLFQGKNSSGKSTILDAICYALFGKPFRNINIPLLVNSINKKDCVVELNLIGENKKHYKIIRGLKPSIFEIYENNELLNKPASKKDYQDILEKSIVKFNIKSFTQIVILGAASFVPFMQLKTADRRAIIEELLDIQIFSVMNSVLSERIKLNKEAIINKKHEIELLEQKYEIEKSHVDSMRQDNESKITNYENEIVDNNNKIELLKSSNIELENIINSLLEEIKNKKKVEDEIRRLIRIESKGENKLNEHRKSLTFYETHTECPTCLNIIDDSFKETKINNHTNEIEISKKSLKILKQNLKTEKEKLNYITEKENELNKIKTNIALNNSSIAETKKYNSKVEEKIIKIKEFIGDDNKEKSLQITTEKLTELKNDLYELLEQKNYYDNAILLLKDTGIKTNIIKQYIPIINAQVNKYLSEFEFFVNFNLDESFKETIKSRHRDEFTYNSFSEGEKMRINMALMLTWRAIAKMKNSTNTNLLFLDEIFDSSLDDGGIDYLMNILHVLENVNLIIISHKGDILHDKFNNVIRFSKEKNFSRKRVEK